MTSSKTVNLHRLPKAKVQISNWPHGVNMYSGKCGQRCPRSVFASAQSEQGLHCPLTIIGYYRIYEWRAKARMIVCASAG